VDQVLAEELADGQVRWALTDHQGTVRDVVDSQGNILNHISYDSFGNLTNESNPDVDFRFGYTGRELDEETGQYYYRARYYDAGVGRFISEDPIGFEAGDPNLYRYVGNSPANYTDPSGNNALGDAYNSFLTSDVTYDIANRADQFFAGFSDATTFGATTKIREAAYGETATRNHQGGLFTTGQVLGTATSIAVGAGAPGTLKKVGLAERFAQGHTVIGAGVASYQSTRNIIEGCATLGDALGYAPAIGYLGKIGAYRFRSIPQGLNKSQFEEISQLARSKAQHIGDDIFVQGSRARGSAAKRSDIDLGVRVSPEKFKQIVTDRMSTLKPDSHKYKTMQKALERGRIHRGEAGLRPVAKEIARKLGVSDNDVDFSIIMEGGIFDKGPFKPLL
jgi:RHS repeat-associated protein